MLHEVIWKKATEKAQQLTFQPFLQSSYLCYKRFFERGGKKIRHAATSPRKLQTIRILQHLRSTIEGDDIARLRVDEDKVWDSFHLIRRRQSVVNFLNVLHRHG